MLILKAQVPHISPPPKARMFWSASKGTYRQHMKQLVRDKKERIRIERLQNCASCYLAKQQISPGGRSIILKGEAILLPGISKFPLHCESVLNPSQLCWSEKDSQQRWERLRTDPSQLIYLVKQQISPVIKLRNSNFI